MASISMRRELPAEFLSDILITAFDGDYGWSWNWFEPASEDWLKKSGNSEDPTEGLWLSCHVRLDQDSQTGNGLFDTTEGFIVDHDVIATGIQRILDDDYLGIWRPASDLEITRIENSVSLYGRAWRGKDEGYEVETGETARAYQEALAKVLVDPDATDIDAPFADAIVQVGIFGKCIFS